MYNLQRLSALTLTIFVVCFCVYSTVAYLQLTSNVENETRSAMSVAKQLIQANVPIPTIESILQESPHLEILRVSGRGLITGQNEALVVPLTENQYLIINPDSQAEVGKIVDSFTLVLMLFATTLVLLILSLRAALRVNMKPIHQLANAVNAIRNGRSVEQLNKAPIPEVQRVITEVTELDNELRQKDAQLLAVDKKLAILQEEERSYLARELHDNVGQLLTTLKVHAFLLTQPLDDVKRRQSIEKINDYCRQIGVAIRSLTEHLHPLVLDKVSLQSALERLVHEQQLAVPSIDWRLDIDFSHYQQDTERDIHIYRIVQEAINNVVKHASASTVDVYAHYGQQHMTVTVVDDGSGFLMARNNGIGLSTMRSRARCIGASFTVNSELEEGTIIRVECDFSQQDDRQSGVSESASNSAHQRSGKVAQSTGSYDAQGRQTRV